jgi:hypothetical protein
MGAGTALTLKGNGKNGPGEGAGDRDQAMKSGPLSPPRRPGPNANGTQLAAGGPKKAPSPTAEGKAAAPGEGKGQRDPEGKGAAGVEPRAAAAPAGDGKGDSPAAKADAGRGPGGDEGSDAAALFGPAGDGRRPTGAAGPAPGRSDDPTDLNPAERAAVERLRQAVQRIQTNRDRHLTKPGASADAPADLGRRRDW